MASQKPNDQKSEKDDKFDAIMKGNKFEENAKVNSSNVNNNSQTEGEKVVAISEEGGVDTPESGSNHTSKHRHKHHHHHHHHHHKRSHGKHKHHHKHK